ncbi:hypothetical protein GEMRC1_006030 [Eukaryota sp. GEM-RC1]
MAHTDRPLHNFPSLHKDVINDIQVNKLGTRLATCSSDGYVFVQDITVNPPQHLASLAGHAASVRRISWSMSGYLATVGESGFLIIFQEQPDSPAVYEPIFKFSHDSIVNDVCFFNSPSLSDPCIVATATEDGYLHVFKQAGEDFSHSKYYAHSAACTCLSFHDELPLIATGGQDNKINIWMEDDDSWKNIFPPLCKHTSTVTDVSFAPSHSIPGIRLMASCSEDGSVFVWSGSDSQFDGSPVVTMPSPVTRVSWSQSGVSLFITSDGISVWSRFNGEWTCNSELDGIQVKTPAPILQPPPQRSMY